MHLWLMVHHTEREIVTPVSFHTYIEAGTGLGILLLCAAVFAFRIMGREQAEYVTGIIFMLSALPLVYLLLTASSFNRPVIYYVQIGCILLFIAAELYLDYIQKTDFRNTRAIVIPYVTLFYGGTGGMIGIVSHSGKMYMVIAVILFFCMMFLSIVQHIKTGM